MLKFTLNLCFQSVLSVQCTARFVYSVYKRNLKQHVCYFIYVIVTYSNISFVYSTGVKEYTFFMTKRSSGVKSGSVRSSRNKTTLSFPGLE